MLGNATSRPFPDLDAAKGALTRMRRRKTNNRLVRPESFLTRTARAVQMLYLTWRLGSVLADEILAWARWFFERRL